MNKEWLKHAKRQTMYEKRYARRFLAVLRANVKEFTDRLTNLEQANVVADIVVTPVTFRDTYLDLYKEVAIPQASSTYNDTKRKAVKFTGIGRDDLWISQVVHYLETNGLEMLTQSVSDTQKKVLLLLIQKGVDEGKSYDEIVKDILTNDIWVTNARRIARTETNRAMNYGHMLGAASLNFQTDKVWISAQDRRTRGADSEDKFDHFHMNEQRVGYDSPFTDPRSGTKLMFPSDPHAPAGATINCRCRVIFEPKRTSDGRLIAKQPSIPQLSVTV